MSTTEEDVKPIMKIRAPSPSDNGDAVETVDFAATPDMWYSDGSVVIVVGKNGYRVHKTILAANCAVFRDLFVVPQPPQADVAVYEGCPVVRLDESDVEWMPFLKAMYDLDFFRPGRKTKFHTLAAILRMSHKYDAPGIRRRAIEIMETVYPTTLQGWETRQARRLIPRFKDEYAAYLVLATETGVTSILPALYFAATRVPLAESVRALEAISPASVSNFAIGQDRLREAEVHHVLAFLRLDSLIPNCVNAKDLGLLRQAAAAALSGATTGHERYHQWCSAHPTEAAKSVGLCAPCTELVETLIRDGRRVVWGNLPTYFGLPSWDELREWDNGED